MPHIIVEYSSVLEDAIPKLLVNLHDALAAAGIDINRIKTRGIRIDHAVVGNKDPNGLMLHGTLLLLEGRDIATKKTYGDALYKLMKAAATPETAVTFEIRDMVKDTYYL